MVNLTVYWFVVKTIFVEFCLTFINLKIIIVLNWEINLLFCHCVI